MVNIIPGEKSDPRTAMLRRLNAAEGDFVSGEEISRELGVSRTSIWKHIQSLRRDGCRIEAVPNRGYRLLGAPDLLLAFVLQAKLKTRTIGRKIHHFDSVDSTQAAANLLAQKGEPDGTVVIAEEQGRGRGRLGRTFFSPRGGLWLSLILKPNLPPQGALALTLLAGVAVSEAVREATRLPVVLKWPNDILIGEKKVVGILGEMIAEVDLVRFVVLGIGINVNVSKKGFPAELKDIATSLSVELGHGLSRSDLLCAVLERFEHYYELLLKEGPAPVLDAWRALPNILGGNVSAETPEGLWQGKAVDIDEEGALLMDVGGEVRKVTAGDVRLVRFANKQSNK